MSMLVELKETGNEHNTNLQGNSEIQLVFDQPLNLVTVPTECVLDAISPRSMTFGEGFHNSVEHALMLLEIQVMLVGCVVRS